MSIRGFLELARPTLQRLAAEGIGSDRIYREIRERLGRGLTREVIRAVSYWERTEHYRNRYYGRVRSERTPDSAFLVRSRVTKQQERYLWEVRYDAFDKGRGAVREFRLSLTSEANRPEDEILEEAAREASTKYGLEGENFRITEAWRKR